MSMIMVLVNVYNGYHILCTLDMPTNERQDNYNVAYLLSLEVPKNMVNTKLNASSLSRTQFHALCHLQFSFSMQSHN